MSNTTENENKNSTQTMDTSNDKIQWQVMDLENQNEKRNKEIDELKEKIIKENDLLKKVAYENRTNKDNQKLPDNSNLELYRKCISTKRKQIKRNKEKISNLKTLGVMVPKKKTDRCKITDLKDKIESLKKEILVEKKKREDVIKEKDGVIELLKKRIDETKEDLKISGWECKFLTQELGKAKGKPASVSDVELQNYINRHTQVGSKRSIHFH